MSDTLTIQPIGPFRATVTPPGSKSLTNRALLLAALGEGSCKLTGVLFADDTRAMMAALRELGFDLEIDEGQQCVTVEGLGGTIPKRDVSLMLGNAGTAYRFLTAACGAVRNGGCYRLDGIARMRQRPVGQLVDALRKLGGDIRYTGVEGYPPLEVRGSGLRGGSVTMPPTLSSQYISALLQAGPYMAQGLELRFDGPVTSRPYVEMTLALMDRFGVTCEVDEHFTRITVPRGVYKVDEYAIEPDASNASYFLAAAAVCPGSTCTIEGLGKSSPQGDVGVADVLAKMGAGLVFGDDFITVMAPPTHHMLRGVDIDLNAMPDMAQTLAVAALFARGTTTLRNIGNLRVKETDRLAALQNELTKFGATVEVEGDDLFIDPPDKLSPPTAPIQTYDDHRMAMSFAVAGLRLPGVVIMDPSCVNKTYPGFFDDLGRLGSRLSPTTRGVS